MMIFLGFGKYVRADRIYALEPIAAGERGSGRRTRVWDDGIPEPLVAWRTERTILQGLGEAGGGPLRTAEGSALPGRLARAAEQGRVDSRTSAAARGAC